jgi:hypothetical protein
MCSAEITLLPLCEELVTTGTTGTPPFQTINPTPGPFDVICARGKQAFNHSGNKYFRSLIERTTLKYSKATNKFQRSIIVSQVVDSIRSNGNGFVRQHKSGWIEVGDHLAREKVGQMLRDGLNTRYSSSSQAKKRRRTQTCAKISQDMQAVVRSNVHILQTMTQLARDVQTPTFSDEQIMELFNQANVQVLNTLKRDTLLLCKFQQAYASSTPMDVSEDMDSSDDETASLLECEPLTLSRYE